LPGSSATVSIPGDWNWRQASAFRQQALGVERTGESGTLMKGQAHTLSRKADVGRPTPVLSFLADRNRFLLFLLSLPTRDQRKADFDAQPAFWPIEGRYFAAMEANGSFGDRQS